MKSGACRRNDSHEGGHSRVQNGEKLPKTAAAIGGLLFAFRHHNGSFLPEEFDQEVLGMKRPDAPRLQVLTPEVAEVEGHDCRRITVDRGRQHMTALFVVVSRVISSDHFGS